MSATIPAAVDAHLLHDHLTQYGLQRIHRGKVRETYALPDQNLFLVIATDRLSIFDFVLPTYVAKKGQLLTALTVFWLTEVLRDIPHHLVAFGTGIDKYLPPSVRGNFVLQKSALIVRQLEMVPVECIVRGYLTGSSLKPYRETGAVCGVQLPPGLKDGSHLPQPIFTPTTKAKTGHDQHLLAAKVEQEHGSWVAERSIALYRQLVEVAEREGFILADTKLEFGSDQTLGDEVGTPDSSRYWDMGEWEAAHGAGKTPPAYDKQVVRDWGKQFGLGDRDTEGVADLEFVAGLNVPQDLLDTTSRRYEAVLERLTGKLLIDFQRSKMGIAV